MSIVGQQLASPTPWSKIPSNDNSENHNPTDDEPNKGNAGSKIDVPNSIPPIPYLPALTNLYHGGQPLAKNPSDGIDRDASQHSPDTQAGLPGVVVSLGTGHVVLDGISYAIPALPTTAPTLVGGQPLRAVHGGGVIAVGSTIRPGSSATIAGHVVSAGSSYAVIDSSTVELVLSSQNRFLLLIGQCKSPPTAA